MKRKADIAKVCKSTRKSWEPKFLNVDMEVTAAVNTKPLAKALGKRVTVLYCGPIPLGYLTTFELPLTLPSPSLDRRLRRFCDMLEALPPPAVRCWKRAHRRVFDIGINSGSARPILVLDIKPGTLARIAALGADIVITVYPTK